MAKPNTIKFCYDVVSPYSFFAFTVLRRYEQHASWKHISVEYIPILLGGIMGATNNQPPATLPARGKQMARDTVRTANLIGIKIKPPSKFPVQTLKCQRLLVVIKDKQPDKLADASLAFWRGLWQEDKDISKDENILDLVGPIFGVDTVKGWMANECNSQKYKDILSANTKFAIDNGAYGAPWFVITNSKGVTEPFFGSDRWAHIFMFLGTPWFGSDPLSAPADAQPSRL